MKDKEAIELLKRYQSGDCSEAEQALVETWYLKHQPAETYSLSEEEFEEDVHKILNTLENTSGPRRIILWSKISIAALILVTLSAGLYFFIPRHQGEAQPSSQAVADIQPGGNKAVLTLADGSKISLTDAGAGEIAKQGGIRITKTADGQVVYTALPAVAPGPATPAYNIIETPRGGKYQLILPDGTVAWLDAASSLRYPLQFADNERSVELSGQAYFEVAKDKSKPFKVISKNQQIEVLGTHFNVNAYPDDAKIVTTLIEGSVRVSLKDQSQASVLKPGERSVLKGSTITVSDADVEEAIAWKNDRFVFENDDVGTMLRKMERWYDVDFEYNHELDDLEVIGHFSRNRTLSEVLRVLQMNREIKFKIEGRRVVVMP
jgi:ferric-dicitrate binding protein FerR (iron transport regulator)